MDMIDGGAKAALIKLMMLNAAKVNRELAQQQFKAATWDDLSGSEWEEKVRQGLFHLREAAAIERLVLSVYGTEIAKDVNEATKEDE